MIDQQYEILIMHEYTCVVDYNEDSMTFNKYAQYRSCAKGFAHYRNEMIKVSDSTSEICREMIHYIAESTMAGNRHFIMQSAKPIYAFFCYPIGIIYYAYLIKTNRKY